MAQYILKHGSLKLDGKTLTPGTAKNPTTFEMSADEAKHLDPHGEKFEAVKAPAKPEGK